MAVFSGLNLASPKSVGLMASAPYICRKIVQIMKQALKIVCGAILLFAIASCNKAEQDFYVDRFNEKIAGDYYYTALNWDGPAVDLDGDGIASIEIAQELDSLNTSILPIGDLVKWPLRIPKCQGIDIQHSLVIRIPMQGVMRESKDGNYHPEMHHHAAFLAFWRLNKTGAVTFENDNRAPEFVQQQDMVYNYSPLADRVDYVRSVDIISIEDGVMHFTYECIFYDFLTKSFVTGTVDAWMKRKPFPINY